MELGWEKVARRLDGIVQPDRPFLSAGENSIEKEASDGIESSLSALLKEKYHVVYHDSMEKFVENLNNESKKTNSRIQLQIHKTKWGQFNDKSDNIKIEDMTSTTYFKNKNILFVASFHDNAVTLSQFHVIAFLCECLAQSITILLPFYSTGTMERVDIGDDGKIPTANTLALLFNGLPSVGRPIRVMTYDMHTLQNRFFFTGHAVATLHTAIPLIKKIIEGSKGTDEEINAIAFPDEGAHKRFGGMFKEIINKDQIIICSKVRQGDDKIIKIADGKAEGKHVLIIDDQTKSGGTLIECAKKLHEHVGTGGGGAAYVSAYVSHFVPTDEFWSKVSENGKFSIFHRFYCTDSIPIENEIERVVDGTILNWTKTDEKGSMTNESGIAKGAQQIFRDKYIPLSLAGLVLDDL